MTTPPACGISGFTETRPMNLSGTVANAAHFSTSKFWSAITRMARYTNLAASFIPMTARSSGAFVGLRTSLQTSSASIFTNFRFNSSLVLDLSTGQGEDPQAMLRWSNDGGSTWSNEYWTSIGKQGKYQNRAIWRQAGLVAGQSV
jgi:hypothetical protein